MIHRDLRINRYKLNIILDMELPSENFNLHKNLVFYNLKINLWYLIEMFFIFFYESCKSLNILYLSFRKDIEGIIEIKLYSICYIHFNQIRLHITMNTKQSQLQQDYIPIIRL